MTKNRTDRDRLIPLVAVLVVFNLVVWLEIVPAIVEAIR